MTLVHWDSGYYRNVGPLKHRVQDYPSIWAYARELYAIPAFHKNTYVLRKLSKVTSPKDKDNHPFREFYYRIAPQIDYEALWAPDNSRKALSAHPYEIYLRHPEGETYEDYAGPISTTIWNSPSWADRNPKNGTISVDASINPLKGLL